VIVVLLPGTGPVELTVTTCRSGQPFLLLHGGAGPHPVTGSASCSPPRTTCACWSRSTRLRRNAPARRACRHSGTRGAPQRPDRAARTAGRDSDRQLDRRLDHRGDSAAAVTGSVLITAAIPIRRRAPAPCRRTCQPRTLCPRQALVKHAGIPKPRRNIMGKIAPEEYVILGREDPPGDSDAGPGHPAVAGGSPRQPVGRRHPASRPPARRSRRLHPARRKPGHLRRQGPRRTAAVPRRLASRRSRPPRRLPGPVHQERGPTTAAPFTT
jgi:hypothetical protein